MIVDKNPNLVNQPSEKFHNIANNFFRIVAI